MASIEALDISSNSLEVLPEDVARLQNLVALNLGCNKLRTLPGCLGAYLLPVVTLCAGLSVHTM